VTARSLTERAASAFIDGAWRATGGPAIDAVDPSTGAAFAQVAAASPADVAAAAEAAARAFPSWRLTRGADRAGYLRAIARGVEARRPALEALQMRNNGKPQAEAAIDVSDAVATFDYYAGLAEDLDARQGTEVAMPDPAFAGRTRFEPVGPVGMIVPWNFPLVTSAWKLAPALAAGCTVVLKTSEFTPLIELAYGDIAQEAGLPAGVLNLLAGAAETGMALTGDARFRKLSFTGSNAVGSRVMAVAAGRCLPISLELGGKSPIVVLADADPELAVDCIMAGIFYNCGQMCSATSRLIVEAGAAPAILDRLIERTRTLVVAAPTDTRAQMGPITTRAQFDRVLGVYEQAGRDGLDCLAGGAGGLRDGGFFVEPTVWADVPRDHPVWRSEIFGPALAVRTFTTEAEALELADDSDYGLVATVVSGDADCAERVAARIDAGHVWINSGQVIFPNTAWGGFKASGIGRELGPWGLGAYLGVKHLTVAAQAQP
jgi:betaine-aldehyde dehydrogenase